MKLLLVAVLIVLAVWMTCDVPLSAWSCDALKAEHQRSERQYANLTGEISRLPDDPIRAYDLGAGVTRGQANAVAARIRLLSDELRHRC